MAEQTQLGMSGAQALKAPKQYPVYIPRFITGLVTNRNPMVQPGGRADFRYYGGRPDALLAGVNCEVSCRNTLVRRPGYSAWTNQSFSNPVLSAIDWFKLGAGNTTSIVNLASTATNVYTITPTSKTSIFTKAGGAGQTFFLGVGAFLYFGDSVSTLSKFDGAKVWNWQISPPTDAPTLTITESGVAAAGWQALTFFSTMGLLVDSNSNVQAMQAILDGTGATGTNATGGNSKQYGLSGKGEPPWNPASGGSTTDGAGTWFNVGPIGQWLPGTTYNWSLSALGTLANPSAIYDPVSNAVYTQINASTLSGVSGSTKPSFNGIVGSVYFDNSVKWLCIGLPGYWQPSTSYTQYNPTFHPGSGIIEGGILPSNPTQVVYLQVNNGTTFTSSASFTNPPWSTIRGFVTLDNQIVWVCLGAAAWPAASAATAWTNPLNYPFSAIKDSNNNWQVCLKGGTTAGSAPTWATTYGAQTTETTGVIWVNCGPATASWVANRAFFLPKTGFNPPQPTDPFGGADILDSLNTGAGTGDVEFAVGSGFSGGSAPSWPAVGATVTDSGATWLNNGPPAASSISWTAGYMYAFAYEARRASDPYNTTPPPGSTLPLGARTGSLDGSVSTASPVFSFTSANTGAVNTLSGPGSADPQADTVDIFRSTDGGGTLKLLTKIPMPAPINGVAQPWTFVDTLPDSTILEEQLLAPLADVNDPPPAGGICYAYHARRPWMAVGNTLYFAGGPDSGIGNGNTNWPPANNFVFSAPIFALVPAQPGLLVFTALGVRIIRGNMSATAAINGASGTVFYDDEYIDGLNLTGYNAWTRSGSQIWAFTSDHRVAQIDATGVNRPAFNVGDQFTALDPTAVCLAYHCENETDEAVYLSQNDSSGKFWRMNPNQAPEGGPVWSPVSQLAKISGAQQTAAYISSVYTALGTRTLLMASTVSGSNSILARTNGTFLDGSNPYPMSATVGSLVLAQPSQLAGVEFITTECAAAGSRPTVSVMLDEIAAINGAAFQTISGVVSPELPDPPELAPSVSLHANRYRLENTCPEVLARHLQITIAFPAENFANEVFTLTACAGLEVE